MAQLPRFSKLFFQLFQLSHIYYRQLLQPTFQEKISARRPNIEVQKRTNMQPKF